MFDRVEVDYDGLERVAAQFANHAGAIQEMIQKVRNSYDDLENGGWIGRGSDAFFSEMESEVFPAIERLRQALEEANRVTKQIANIMETAEDEASTRFRAS